MSYTSEYLSEMNLLNQFSSSGPTTGIKVHSTASPDSVDAAARLHEKGLTTQVDGGYLTASGVDAAHHALALLRALQVEES